jgi:hypothetical protein
MPANVAHTLIAHKAKERFKTIDPESADLLLSKNNHYYLGSIGPDLPSYKTSNLVKEALNSLFVRPFVDKLNPQEEDASFFLHSTRPHLFPFYLMETNLSYAEIVNDKVNKKEFNNAVFAFAMGYVTHIAADQIVHRLVRSIVGPYYRSLEVSQKHSECEVHQDIFLFYELYPDKTFDKAIQKEIVDVNKLYFEYEQFCNMISLAISKAGYKKITEEDIDGWLNGIKLTFDLMGDIGPYVSALKNYDKNKNNLASFSLYKKYYRDPQTNFNYMDYFNRSVDLSIKYMTEINRLWKEMDFSFESLQKYQGVIQSDDLTSPLRIVDI